MNKGLEALKRIRLQGFVFNDRHNPQDLDTIEKELKRLEELEKAFDALSKDDEKAKKLLSKEIEKNRALEIIKETLNLKVYKNKLGQCFLEGINILIPIDQEKYNLLKEVLL